MRGGQFGRIFDEAIAFDPGASGMTSTDVHAAIIEAFDNGGGGGALEVQSDGATIDLGVAILDFSSQFTLVESPEDDIDISLNLGAIDHDLLLNFAPNEHFTEASIDHDNINVGTDPNPHNVTITQAIAAESLGFTAANLTTLTDGSNADALHVHASNVGTSSDTEILYNNSCVIDGVPTFKYNGTELTVSNRVNITDTAQVAGELLKLQKTNYDLTTGTDQFPFNIDVKTTTLGGEDLRALNLVATVNATGSQTGIIYASRYVARLSDDAATVTIMIGSHGQIQNSSSGTISNAYAFRSLILNNNTETGVITQAINFYADGIDAEDGTITTAYGVKVDAHEVDTGTLSTAYGIWIAEQANGSTNRSLWLDSGAVAHFRDHNTKIYSSASNTLNLESTTIVTSGNINHQAFYIDIDDIAVPSNPVTAGVRRLFVDTSTGELSVRTVAGATVSLESAGGGDPDQNLWLTMAADTGSIAANIVTDTFTITGGTSITTAISGDSVVITNDAPNVDQNLFLNVLSDSGTAVADNITDTLSILGGSGISTAVVADALTITNDSPNVTQNLFETISCPAGTNPIADSATDTLSFTAGTGLTITVRDFTEVATRLTGTRREIDRRLDAVRSESSNSFGSFYQRPPRSRPPPPPPPPRSSRGRASFTKIFRPSSSCSFIPSIAAST